MPIPVYPAPRFSAATITYSQDRPIANAREDQRFPGLEIRFHREPGNANDIVYYQEHRYSHEDVLQCQELRPKSAMVRMPGIGALTEQLLDGDEAVLAKCLQTDADSSSPLAPLFRKRMFNVLHGIRGLGLPGYDKPIVLDKAALGAFGKRFSQLGKLLDQSLHKFAGKIVPFVATDHDRGNRAPILIFEEQANFIVGPRLTYGTLHYMEKPYGNLIAHKN